MSLLARFQLPKLFFSRFENEDALWRPPEISGWLEQQDDRNRKKWRRRFFVLKGSFLFYFLQAESLAPKGVIPLEYSLLETSEEMKNLDGVRYTILIKVHKAYEDYCTRMSYKLSSKKEGIRDAWISALNSSVLPNRVLVRSLEECGKLDALLSNSTHLHKARKSKVSFFRPGRLADETLSERSSDGGGIESTTGDPLNNPSYLPPLSHPKLPRINENEAEKDTLQSVAESRYKRITFSAPATTASLHGILKKTGGDDKPRGLAKSFSGGMKKTADYGNSSVSTRSLSPDQRSVERVVEDRHYAPEEMQRMTGATGTVHTQDSTLNAELYSPSGDYYKQTPIETGLNSIAAFQPDPNEQLNSSRFVAESSAQRPAQTIQCYSANSQQLILDNLPAEGQSMQYHPVDNTTVHPARVNSLPSSGSVKRERRLERRVSKRKTSIGGSHPSRFLPYIPDGQRLTLTVSYDQKETHYLDGRVMPQSANYTTTEQHSSAFSNGVYEEPSPLNRRTTIQTPREVDVPVEDELSRRIRLANR